LQQICENFERYLKFSENEAFFSLKSQKFLQKCHFFLGGGKVAFNKNFSGGAQWEKIKIFVPSPKKYIFCHFGKFSEHFRK
jgi:hypothetical protein